MNLLPSGSTRKAPTRFRHILAAGSFLVLALCVVVGPLLRLIQPALVALGRVDDWKMLVAAILLVNVLQWFSGWRALRRMRDLLDNHFDGLRSL